MVSVRSRFFSSLELFPKEAFLLLSFYSLQQHFLKKVGGKNICTGVFTRFPELGVSWSHFTGGDNLAGTGAWSSLLCALLVHTWEQNQSLKFCRTSPLKQRVGIRGGKGELGIFHILVLNLNQWFSQPREGVCLFSYGIGVVSSCAKYLWGREETTWSFWEPEKNFGGWKRNKINFLCNFESAESVLPFMPSRESRIITELRKKSLKSMNMFLFKETFYFWLIWVTWYFLSPGEGCCVVLSFQQPVACDDSAVCCRSEISVGNLRVCFWNRIQM